MWFRVLASITWARLSKHPPYFDLQQPFHDYLLINIFFQNNFSHDGMKYMGAERIWLTDCWAILITLSNLRRQVVLYLRINKSQTPRSYCCNQLRYTHANVNRRDAGYCENKGLEQLLLRQLYRILYWIYAPAQYLRANNTPVLIFLQKLLLP
jgi:hypothetical protein